MSSNESLETFALALAQALCAQGAIEQADDPAGPWGKVAAAGYNCLPDMTKRYIRVVSDEGWYLDTGPPNRWHR